MWWPWLCRYLVMCIVGGLKSCVLCGGAIPPKLKVARLLYFHHSRCCHCWWRSPAWQTPRRTPQRQRLHRIRSSVPCMVHPAALPVLCSRRNDSGSEEEEPKAERHTCTRRARRQDRQELGRTTEPTLHSTEDERFSPPSSADDGGR